MTAQATKEKILVLGIDTPIGLSIVRELGQHGLEVHGVARTERGVGLYSRWLSKGYILPGPRDAHLTELQTLLTAHNIPTLMAVSESDLLWLNNNRQHFPTTQLLIPQQQQLETVLDKAKLYKIAQQIGVPVPVTLEPTSLESVKDSGLNFPVVLKWPDPNRIIKQLNSAGISLLKFEYAYDMADLLSKLGRYVPIGSFPLVQEFCPGHGLGQMFLMHQGEVGLYFQHRRLHEWPPEGGVSSLCTALAPELHASLREKSQALLKALAWEGVAMVEYRYDPDSGRYALMEINGRFWGSLPLASQAGAEFAWELYRQTVHNAPAPALGRYQINQKCLYAIPEIKRLAVILLAKQRIQNRLLRFSPIREIISLITTWLNPNTTYYVFQWSDPKPLLVDLLTAIRDLILQRR